MKIDLRQRRLQSPTTTISPFTAGVYNGRMNKAKFIQERHISLKLRVFTEYVTGIRMFTERPSLSDI